MLADYHRPVAKRGFRDIELVGNYLRKGKIIPDFVLSSGALRAYTTASKICELIEFSGEISVSDRLYFEGSGAIINEIRQLHERYSRVFLFSHNPALNEICLDLLGLNVSNLPTCSCVFTASHCSNWTEWKPEKVKVTQLLRPKELRNEHK